MEPATAQCVNELPLSADVGFKFGGWVDIVLMQRALGCGATTLPGPINPGEQYGRRVC